MGKQKSRQSTMSSGKMKAIRKAREEKRQAKFAAKRDAGNAYTYKPIEAKKGTSEWNREKLEREQKAKSSRCDYAVWTGTMRKVQNELDKQAADAAQAKRAKARKNKDAD